MSPAAAPHRSHRPTRAGPYRTARRYRPAQQRTATRYTWHAPRHRHRNARPGPFRPARLAQPGKAPGLRPAGEHQCPYPPWARDQRACCSGRQDLVEQGFRLVLVRLLGKRKFAHQNLPRLGEHALLAGGQAAFLIAAPKIPDNLGDLVHVTRSELLKIGLVTPRPVRGLFGMRRAKHLEDALKPLGTNDIPNSYQFGIIRGNAYCQVALINLEDQISFVFTLDGASLDRLDASRPMMGIDDGIADLERHVASTPSAEGHLTTYNGVDKMPMPLNMQVSA